MKLSQIQWRALWISEGGNASKSLLASAIVMAESGGNTKAVSSTNDYGGYQINLPSHPDVSKQCAFNPICATQKAIQISNNGADFSPWVTYQHGEQEKYMHETVGFNPGDILKYVSPIYRLFHGEPPVPTSPIQEGVEGITGIHAGSTGELFQIPGQIIAFFQHASELFFSEAGWVRIGKTVGGSILVLWGLRVLVRESTGADPVRTVTKVSEQAAAAAAVVK